MVWFPEFALLTRAKIAAPLSPVTPRAWRWYHWLARYDPGASVEARNAILNQVGGGLVHLFAARHRLNNGDWEADLWAWMIRAAETYDPRRGAWSTWAMRHMLGGARNRWRAETRPSRGADIQHRPLMGDSLAGGVTRELDDERASEETRVLEIIGTHTHRSKQDAIERGKVALRLIRLRAL